MRAERACADGHRTADGAEPDQPDGGGVEQTAEGGAPLVLTLELVEIGEALPHAEQARDDELGDGHRRDADRVRDHDAVGEAGVVEVVDSGADRLHPAQIRRELVHPLREVERHDDLGALPHRDGARR